MGGSFVARNDVMSAVLKVWRQIENPMRRSMRVYLKNIPVKIHPDPIWNDGSSLWLFLKRLPEQQ